MDTTRYEAFMSRVSQEIAERFLSQEDNIAERALFIDADIAEITQHIGLEATQRIYEQALNQQVSQKKTRDSKSSGIRPLNLT